MKLSFSTLLLLLVFLSSCQEDPKVRALEQKKETQKREVIFTNINKGWNFNAQPINETSRELRTNWTEWRLFLNELGQKPKSSIGAFQQKAKTLCKRAAELNNNIPIKYNLLEIKSRIAVITTKINAINLYIHLNQIPDKKIVQLVQEIHIEVASMQWQLDEIKRKSEIKMEEGESDMIRMLDTTRAIPNNPKPKIIK
ncbi:MAG: hypothetical protein ACOYLP_00050 [Flavobacterium sp.]|uniref:hypothetical protein n=1 Tax=Flavobacterium sp. TaxID=239 RepID=UPI003BC863E0